ncbi:MULTISPECIES: NADH-quinone oxidoreductase subunit J [unclassified Guyparkeria]|uniref:NADH-quinone oxidoreductase subunit J n=1 Tax=unclassified Guyparkeria TaxID=2626246 RepID=UPI0007336040|nr:MULTISPECIES: NADH-quinone oxidoreductase subunit J [unclassified Guyparkeria]KTG16259.1 NADH:ubiquinone oxidoreductase subunit J [Guyparkeria sp. XI15]OAE85110.1 NADH:ubiquinone oxidoreductase subunit J [Guyparkeria sp. WRN-7]
MSLYQILFYVFASVAVIAAIRVVTVRNPVHAALFLVLTFFSTALVWVLMEAEFLGIVLLLVYVGAVMVLFLFVVMMLDVNIAPLREGFIKNLPVGVFVALVMIVELALILGPASFGLDIYPAPEAAPAGTGNTLAIGQVLYTKFVYPFEIAAFILLVAIVAAIALAHRRRPGVHYQDIDAQVRVRAEDRVRIAELDADKTRRGDLSGETSAQQDKETS